MRLDSVFHIAADEVAGREMPKEPRMSEQKEPVHFEEMLQLDNLSSEKATAQLIELAVRLPASDMLHRRQRDRTRRSRRGTSG